MTLLAPKENDWTGISKCRKAVTTIIAILECILSGIIYGWPSLIIVLKEEGIFSDLCEESNNYTYNGELSSTSIPHYNTSQSCTAQDERFSLVFMICAILMTAGCALFGYMQYLWGCRITRLIDMTLYVFGALCMAFLNKERSWLLFIAAPAIAVAGPPILIVNIQVANLYTSGASMLVGIFTGTYDASAIVQLVVKQAYYSGISLRTSYISITCVLSLMFVGTFFILPKTYIPKAIEVEIEITATKLDPHDMDVPKTKENINRSLEETIHKEVYSQKRKNNSDTLPYNRASLVECLRSKLYLFHVFWLSILQLRFYFYIGSLNVFLLYTTNWHTENVDYYTNIGLYIQIGGLIGAPLIGMLLDFQRHRHRHYTTIDDRIIRPTIAPLILTCIIATVFSAINLIPSTILLILLFVTFTLFRASLYGLVAAFIQMIFPGRYFGILWGVTMVVGGLFSALQYPLFIWMDTPPVGPMKANILLLVLTLIAFSHPLYIWMACRSRTKQSIISTNTQLLDTVDRSIEMKI